MEVEPVRAGRDPGDQAVLPFAFLVERGGEEADAQGYAST